jgi:tRNA pseudouridine32 synthase/23S rRNA pseudouridine746 synthase
MIGRPSPTIDDLVRRILMVDAHVLILDKPAGMAVHPGPTTPHSLEAHLIGLRQGFVRSPQPAHRLDRDTSGCLVLARHPKALKRLSVLFAAGRVAKTYWALVDGVPEGDAGEVDAPLLKVSTAADGWRMVVDPAGKAATTRWRVLERAAQSLIEFTPATGRTHQIRVHAATLGTPICGDPVYGEGAGPMRLHARRLVVPYADDRDAIDATAPLPGDWPGLRG